MPGVVWNDQLYADYKAEEDRLETLLNTIKQELEDQYESDGWDENKRLSYMMKQNRHRQLSDELGSIKLKISNMELVKPQDGPPAPRADAFGRWVLRGAAGLESDERDFYLDEIVSDELPGGGGETFVMRPENLTRSDDASGQELVPETVVPRVVQTLAYYGGIAKMARHFMTNTGNDYRIPQNDGKDDEGELLLNQGEEVAEGALKPFGIVNFGAYTSSSKAIKITREMLTDSIIDVEAFAREAISRRLGKLWDRIFTLGNKAANPEVPGITQLAKVGITTAANNAVTYKEINDLKYTIDKAYRESGEMGEGGLMNEGDGMTGWLISDGLEQLLSNLVDGDGRPFWRTQVSGSLENNMGNRLLGYPYQISGKMAGVGAGNIVGLFGNFSYYGIRTVKNLEVFRFQDSATMKTNSIECIGFSRRSAKNMISLNSGKLDMVSALRLKP